MHSIAVIVPLFNGAPWIERTLASVLAQTRRPDEIVVVDDGSDDDGPARVRRFAEVQLLRNPSKGPNSARNHGLQQSRGPLVAFLDHDDVWHPMHLEVLAGILEAHPGAVAASSACVSFKMDPQLRWPPMVTPEVSALDPWRNFPFGSIRSPSTALFRREPLTAVGGWNPKSNGVADVDLPLRLSVGQAAASGVGAFLYSDASTVGYRVHPDSYNGVLRCQQVDRYMLALGQMAGRVASEHLIRRPDRKVWLTRRLEIAAQFLEIARHFVADDAGGMVQAVDVLAERLEPEPVDFRSDAFHTLFWFLCTPAMPGRKRRLLAHLYAHWPARAGSARSILWAEMRSWPRRFFISHFLSRPWRRNRLALVRRIAISQGSVPDPGIYASGVDADGWARGDCAWSVPKRRGRQGLRVGIELPGWAGIDAYPLMLTVPPNSQQQLRLPAGYYDVVIPWTGAAEHLAISLRCDRAFRLPHDDRLRSLRITGIHYEDRVAVARPVIQPCTQAQP